MTDGDIFDRKTTRDWRRVFRVISIRIWKKLSIEDITYISDGLKVKGYLIAPLEAGPISLYHLQQGRESRIRRGKQPTELFNIWR